MVSFDNPRRQAFSLPPPLMNTIMKNQSAEVYNKLIRTSKYFFSKLRIVVVSNCWNKSFLPWFAFTPFEGQRIIIYSYPKDVEEHKVFYCPKHCFLGLDIKLWITDFFRTWDISTTSFVNKIFKNEASYIQLTDHHLTYKEYSIIVGLNSRSIHLKRISVIDDQGSEVRLGKLLELSPNLHRLVLISGNFFTRDGLTSLLEMPQLQQLQHLYLSETSSSFDFDLFCAFLKKHKVKICKIYGPQDEEAVGRRAILKRILDTWDASWSLPKTTYNGAEVV